MFDDEVWKRSIKDLFRPMVAFHLPELHDRIDWTRGHEFLEQELARIMTPEAKDKRYVDVLAKVAIKDGTEEFLLLHVEIQGYTYTPKGELSFPERMFQYFYRIKDKFGKNITALAIFTDANPDYRPDCYEYSCYGTSLTYRYNIYKVLAGDEETLEASDNPFAVVMLAAQKALRIRKSDDRTKMVFQLSLIRRLIRKGFTNDQIESLCFFIDWIVSFEDVNRRYELGRNVRSMLEVKKVPYVTSLELYMREEIKKELEEKIGKELEEKIGKEFEEKMEKELEEKTRAERAELTLSLLSQRFSKEELAPLVGAVRLAPKETLDRIISEIFYITLDQIRGIVQV